MGFFDKMKAANGLSLGAVESPDFPACKILVKNGVPVIISGALNGPNIDYPIYQRNIRVFKVLGCGGDWVKYYILFKDGKCGVITSDVISEAKRREIAQGRQRGNGAFGTGITAAPLERYLKLVDPGQSSVPLEESNETIPMEEEQEIVEVEEPSIEESYEEQEESVEEPTIDISEYQEVEESETEPEEMEEHKVSGLALGIIIGVIVLVIVVAIVLLATHK